MNINWSPMTFSYQYSCVWGCLDYDYDTYADAYAAFQNHDCVGAKS